MLSQEAVQTILNIGENVNLSTLQMAKQLKVTFNPDQIKASKEVKAFAEIFRKSLNDLGVEVVSFESIWEKVSIRKRFRRFIKYSVNNIVWVLRKILNLPEISFFLSLDAILQLCSKYRIKKGICIVCIGEQDSDMLSMQYISNFKTNSIITIVDFPKKITHASSFREHFDAAMSLFAYHMTNIVIAVNNKQWMVYNFNASHPIFSIYDPEFNNHVLNSIIPKIAAPISPCKLDEFKIMDSKFSVSDQTHKYIVDEMRIGAGFFDRTGLYPYGKNINELPFRRNFHRLIGKLHLDNRSGMSFGFIAFQMPVDLHPVLTLKDFKKKHKTAFLDKDYFIDDLSRIFLCIDVKDVKLVVVVPDVWVMTLRSGANKTNFNSDLDLLKLGLINGKMVMQLPTGLKLNRDYKPSFDTKVILAHAVGNSILAEIFTYFKVNKEFSQNLSNHGMAITHWHGYLNKKCLPNGLAMYGRNNPHVSCSSPQSAIYALQGKLENIYSDIQSKIRDNYIGDIHIEPHHGINVCYPTLTALAKYIIENPMITELGNKYL